MKIGFFKILPKNGLKSSKNAFWAHKNVFQIPKMIPKAWYAMLTSLTLIFLDFKKFDIFAFFALIAQTGKYEQKCENNKFFKV